MSRDGSITFEWGDGEHKFRLAIGELQELQEKCNWGPEEVFRRLEAGTWWVNDLIEPIRLGLIGGGMDVSKARSLVQRYVTAGNLMGNVDPAMLILAAALVGVPDEAPKKVTEEEKTATIPSSLMESGALPPSTATVQ